MCLGIKQLDLAKSFYLRFAPPFSRRNRTEETGTARPWPVDVRLRRGRAGRGGGMAGLGQIGAPP